MCPINPQETTVRQSFRRWPPSSHRDERIWFIRKNHQTFVIRTESLGPWVRRVVCVTARRREWRVASCCAAGGATKRGRPRPASTVIADLNGVARSPVRSARSRSTSTLAADGWCPTGNKRLFVGQSRQWVPNVTSDTLHLIFFSLSLLVLYSFVVYFFDYYYKLLHPFITFFGKKKEKFAKIFVRWLLFFTNGCRVGRSKKKKRYVNYFHLNLFSVFFLFFF